MKGEPRRVDLGPTHLPTPPTKNHRYQGESPDTTFTSRPPTTFHPVYLPTTVPDGCTRYRLLLEETTHCTVHRSGTEDGGSRGRVCPCRCK